MKNFSILIRWRSYLWKLRGIARSGVDLITGMAEHFPPDARVTVRCERDDAEESRRAQWREDYARDMEPYTRPSREGDVTP